MVANGDQRVAAEHDYAVERESHDEEGIAVLGMRFKVLEALLH